MNHTRCMMILLILGQSIVNDVVKHYVSKYLLVLQLLTKIQELLH